MNASEQFISGQKYTGHSPWASWPKQLSTEAVYQPADTLSLSPSSLNTYMQCPRKFFYQKTLGLRGESSEEASMGTLIHRLMEVFNKTLNSPQDHTLERLMACVETLFSPENFSTHPPVNPENRGTHQQQNLPEAFQDKDLLPLKNLTLLARSELKYRVVSALQDLIG
ncbi:MAG: PD-(D/E)XK nuclease family protein, partial [Cyanobacteria bacterium]|nr:PD-(D/E)XK nuclease family protein [Cyanobacteriota bacterium]